MEKTVIKGPLREVAGAEKTPSGKIVVEAHLPGRNEVSILIDHIWYKGDFQAAPHEEGAHEAKGWLAAGEIKGGETQTFELTAGEHEITVTDHVFGGEPIKVVLIPGETQKFLLRTRHKGLRRFFHQMDIISKVETPKNSYYCLQKIPNN